MRRKIHTYESDGITVSYDVARCIHAAECVRGLPEVFDPDRKPWVDPDEAPANAVARVIENCPTGALHYERHDGGPAETAPDTNVVRVSPDGPLYLRGRIQVRFPDGSTLEDTRVALCRCGASANKPLCDNAHHDIAFRADGRGLVKEPTPAESDSDVLVARPLENGCLMLEGPFRLESADGLTASGGKAAMCRCGLSATRPYCDGSHRDAGFEAAGA